MVFVVGTNSSNAAFVPVSKIAVEIPDVGLVPKAAERATSTRTYRAASDAKGTFPGADRTRTNGEAAVGEVQVVRELPTKPGRIAYLATMDETAVSRSLPANPITSAMVPPNIIPNKPTLSCDTYTCPFLSS